jgi:hypothetical protein
MGPRLRLVMNSLSSSPSRKATMLMGWPFQARAAFSEHHLGYAPWASAADWTSRHVPKGAPQVSVATYGLYSRGLG